jgi:rhodanese-related sulfurtransferase
MVSLRGAFAEKKSSPVSEEEAIRCELRMKRGRALIGLLASIVAGMTLCIAQEHPAPVANAPETAANKLREQLDKGEKILVIDVRNAKEYERGHIPGAINVPLEDLRARISDLKPSKDTTIVTVCEHGGRSSRAVLELQKLGYRATSFCKLDAWKKEGYKTETGNGKKISQVYKFICRHYCNADKQVRDLDEHCECACNQPYRECMNGE